MHRQFGQQVGHLALVAHQPQVRHLEHGLQQALHLQLGQAVGNAHHQAHGLNLGSAAHHVGQGLAQLEDVLGLPQCHHAGIGQFKPAPSGPQQLAAQVTLQLAHLGAHRLDGHVQPGGRVRHASFFGHHPEVIQMAVIEQPAHIQYLQK